MQQQRKTIKIGYIIFFMMCACFKLIAQPNFSTPPSENFVTSTGFEITAGIDETGFINFVVLPSGSPFPSSAEVVAEATNPGSTSIGAINSGSVGVTANNPGFRFFSGLSPSTTYDVYVVGEDQLGNAQATATFLQVTTSASDVTPPSFSTAPSASNLAGTGFDITAAIDEAGFINYVVLAVGSPMPSASDVVAEALNPGSVLGSIAAGWIPASATTLETLTVSGLTVSTTYDVYIVAEDNSGNLQSSPTLITVTTTSGGGGGSAPVFQNSTPSASNITSSSFDLTVNMDVTGYVSYVALPSGSAAPSSNQVVNGQDADDNFVLISNGFPITTADTDEALPVTGLSASTTYDVYIVADDNGGNLQSSPTLITVTTTSGGGGGSAPVFQNSTPSVSNITSSSFDLTVNMDVTGYVSYVALPSGSAAPSSNQVVNGQDADDNFVLISNGFPITTADTDEALPVTGLSASTTYDVYIVADDNGGNLQSSPTLITVTTTSGGGGGSAPVFQNSTPSVSNITSSSFDLTVNMDVTGYVSYVALPSGSAAPSSNQVVNGQDADDNFVLISNGFPITTADTDEDLPVTGLSASTTYDVYIVADDNGGNLQSSPTSITVTTTSGGGGGSAPVFQNSTPSASNITSSSFDLTVNLDVTGYVSYVALPSGSAAPSSNQVVNGQDADDNFVLISNGSPITTADTDEDLPVTGLSASTTYDVYIVADDNGGNLQSSPTLITVTTTSGGGGGSAPVFQNSTPSASNITSSSFDLTVNLDVTGYVSYVALPSGSAAPSSNQVVNGQDADDNFVLISNGSPITTADTDEDLPVTGLSASTTYDVYIVADDNGGNLQSSPTLITVTTTSGGGGGSAPVFQNSTPSASNITSSSFDLTVNLDVTGYVSYVALPSGSAAPSSNQVVNGQDADDNFVLISNGSPITTADTDEDLPVTGLSASTTYDVYIVADDNGGNLQSSPTLITVTTTSGGGGGSAPVFQNSTPSVSNITSSSFDLTVNMDVTGYVSYVALPSGSAAPSSNQVVNGQDADDNFVLISNGFPITTADTDEDLPVTGLSASTTYDVYIVADDNGGNLQSSPTLITVTTTSGGGGGSAPVFQNSTPSASNITSSSFDLTVNLDVTGYVSYVALPSGSAAPSSNQVVNGQDADDNFVLISNGFPITTADTDEDLPVTGLSASTTYDVYIVADDNGGNLQSSPTSITVTTTSGGGGGSAPVFQNSTPSASNITSSSFDLTVNLDVTGYVSYVALPSGSAAPSSNQVVNGQDADDNFVLISNGSPITTADTDEDLPVTGLSASTTYDVYIVADDNGGNLQSSPTLITVTTTSGGGGGSAPVFQNSTPSASNITSSSFDLTVNLDVTGYVSYVALPSGSAAPSSNQVVNGQDADDNFVLISNGSPITTADTDEDLPVTGLSASTTYDVYIVADDNGGNLQSSPTLIMVTTTSGGGGDVTPPVFTVGPLANNVVSYGFDLELTLDEDGVVYYVVLPDGSAAPSAIQVSNFEDSNGDPVAIGGQQNANELVDLVINFNGLTPSTSLDIYVVAEDNSGNLQVTPSLVEVTTAVGDVTPPSFDLGPQSNNIGLTGFDIEGQLNEQGEIYFVVLTSGAPVPSTAQVVTQVDGAGDPATYASNASTSSSSPYAFSVNAAGLTASTTYDVYVVAMDLPGNTSTPAYFSVTTTAGGGGGDVTPPVLTAGPQASNITSSSFDIISTLDEDGVVFVVVLPDGSDQPSPEDVKAEALAVQDEGLAPSSVIARALSAGYSSDLGFGTSFSVGSLYSSSDYDVYVIAEDISAPSNIQTLVTKVDVSTLGPASGGDDTPPVFQNATPSISNITSSSVDISVELDEVSVVHVVALPDGATPPNNAQVVAGLDGNANTGVSNTLIDVTFSGQEYTETLSGLEPSSDYDIYVVAKDSEVPPNYQIVPVLVEMTTAPSNDAPVLAAIGDQAVDEGVELTFTAVATDADLPAQVLTYSLDATSLGEGMTINASSGEFSWTPGEAQDGAHTVTVTVSDGIATDSEMITVTVNEVNEDPVLTAIGDQSVDEGVELTFTAVATDADLPAQVLTYSLDATSLGEGMAINASSGEFSWTPGEAQDGAHTVTVTVSDGTATDSEMITVTVNEVNEDPVFTAIGDQAVDEGVELTFTAVATDADLPAQVLTYSLDATSLGEGMTINASSGEFSWTPGEAQDGAHTVTVTVSDGTVTDEETITVTVNEVNEAPVLTAIGDQTVDEGVELTFTAVATDADLPAQVLTYGLDATSLGEGMTINASSGEFSWTPGEAQDGAHTVTVTVSDGTEMDEETITVTVNEVNEAPVLTAIGDQTVDEGVELTFTAVATDADLPAQVLTYSLDATSLGEGMTINASSGEFSWTPGKNQNGAHSVILTVSDGEASDELNFMISVENVLGFDSNVQLRVYPNPTKDYFRISGFNNDKLLVEVYDLNGAEHKITHENQHYNVSHLASGTYFIYIKDQAGQLVSKQRIVKMK